jgi:hypothetical protein
VKVVATILWVSTIAIGAGLIHHAQSKFCSSQIEAKAEATVLSLGTSSQCKCFCGGKSWRPGSTACMGSFKQRCVNSPSVQGVPGRSSGVCSWATVKQGKDPVPCDGEENCKE